MTPTFQSPVNLHIRDGPHYLICTVIWERALASSGAFQDEFSGARSGVDSILQPMRSRVFARFEDLEGGALLGLIGTCILRCLHIPGSAVVESALYSSSIKE